MVSVSSTESCSSAATTESVSQAQVHHKARHGNGVADIAFAGKARLPRMGRRSHLVSLFDAPGVVWAAGIRHGPCARSSKSLRHFSLFFHHCAASSLRKIGADARSFCPPRAPGTTVRPEAFRAAPTDSARAVQRTSALPAPRAPEASKQRAHCRSPSASSRAAPTARCQRHGVRTGGQQRPPLALCQRRAAISASYSSVPSRYASSSPAGAALMRANHRPVLAPRTPKGTPPRPPRHPL